MSHRAASILIVVTVVFGVAMLGTQIWMGIRTRSCRDHCFPFASRWEPVQGCWCADLGDTWHPDDW